MVTRNKAVPSVRSDEGDRIAPRHKTFEPTILRSEAGEARAHLLNVSATGALVHMANPPKLGSLVSIDLGDMPTEAHVVWTSGTRFGVAFRNSLPSATLDIVLRA